MLIQRLMRLRDLIASAMPTVSVVDVHTQDLSDAQTGTWLVRLPGVYLVARGISRSEPDMMRAECLAFVLVRLADMRQAQSVVGWDVAEMVFALIASRPDVHTARLRFVDERGLDAPGIGLWEIAFDLMMPMPDVADDALCALAAIQAEEVWMSWAPWIGAAHVEAYERTDRALAPGETLEDVIP